MSDIPKEIEKYFENKQVKFKVSKFEEYMINDIYESDESSKIKLNRNVTQDLLNEIDLYIEEKRNIRYSMKGETRDGKSLISLKLLYIIIKKLGKNFNDYVEYMVCGNQIEYRKKLKNAEFGDAFLIDENFFNQSGLGANIESAQLKDYNSQIAKMNISCIFINPEKFLNVGATLGISTYGRDSKNWLSRVLIYKFKNNFPYLIGYAIINVGTLFSDNGCYIYRETGGCNNTNNIKFKDINPILLKYSNCIPKKYNEKDIINNGKVCPMYNVCTHGLCKYEHKKDSWIKSEMTGTLDERTYERFKLSIELMLDLGCELILESNIIKIKAKNSKDLKNRVKIKLYKFTNTKMGIGEFDELIEIIKSNTYLDMFIETLIVLENKQLKEKAFNIENGNIIEDMYNKRVNENKDKK